MVNYGLIYMEKNNTQDEQELQINSWLMSKVRFTVFPKS